MFKLERTITRVLAVGCIAMLLMASISVLSYAIIENAGTPLTQRNTLNFTGTGINCVDNAGAARTDCTVAGVGVANYAQSFTSQTTVVLTHNLKTTSTQTQCYDNSAPPNWITPANIAVTDANTVTVTFSALQSGSCVVNGAAAGTATSVPFSGITTGSNTTATMTVGTGGTLTYSGSGVVNASQLGGVAASGYVPYTGATGTLDLGSHALYSFSYSGNCVAGIGGVTLNTLVKLANDGTCIAVTGSEALLGVAQASASAGTTIPVTVVGPSMCIAEGSITAGNYLIAGSTLPSHCKDSGVSTLNSIALSQRLAGKSLAAATDGAAFAMFVLGPYRFGAMVDLTTNVTGVLPVANGGTGTSSVLAQYSVPVIGASGVWGATSGFTFGGAAGGGLAIPSVAASGTNAYGLQVASPTGATNNYSASFTGGLGVAVNTYENVSNSIDQESTPAILGSETSPTLQSDTTASTATTMTPDLWYAMKFTASGAYNVRGIGVRLSATGLATVDATKTITLYLYSDSAGAPGTSLASGQALRLGSLTGSAANYQLGVSYATVSSTAYWIVIKLSAAPSSGSVSLYSYASAGSASQAAGGTAASPSWAAATDYKPYFLLYGQSYYGVRGFSTNSIGVQGSSTNNTGVQGSSINSIGVYGSSTNSIGVQGSSTNNIGVQGSSTNSTGIRGSSTNNIGGEFYISGVLSSDNALNTVLVHRFPSGTNNLTGNVLQITDNPTSSGTISGAEISVQVDSTERFRYDPRVLTGATAVGTFIDTATSLTTAGAKLLSVRNAGVEKFYVGYNGLSYGLGTQISATYSVAGTALPSCAVGTLLQRLGVTDATVATPGSTYVGGGTYTTSVKCIFNSTGSVYTWIID